MRLVQIKNSPKPIPTKKNRSSYFFVILLLLFSVSGFQMIRPLPPAQLTIDQLNIPKKANPTLDWPATGEATLSAAGYDTLVSNAQPKQVSTASMAKVITVLTVLEKRPLKLDESGPTIVMTQADVDRFLNEQYCGGSNLPISLGEKLTQHQMIEAIMLPSANNIADSLAIWAFGSLANYKTAAEKYLQKNGLDHTVIGGDASGFDPATVSTTEDLTKLTKLAAASPVLAKIASTKQANFETAGTIKNTNFLLGQSILTGLKTGMNDGNSGGFMFTANVAKASRDITILGAITDAGSSRNAIVAANQLARSASDDFVEETVAKKNHVVGHAVTRWGEKTEIVAAEDLTVVRWRANPVWHSEQLNSASAVKAESVGNLTIRTNGDKNSVRLDIKHPAKKPSVWWRLTRLN